VALQWTGPNKATAFACAHAPAGWGSESWGQSWQWYLPVGLGQESTTAEATIFHQSSPVEMGEDSWAGRTNGNVPWRSRTQVGKRICQDLADQSPLHLACCPSPGPQPPRIWGVFLAEQGPKTLLWLTQVEMFVDTAHTVTHRWHQQPCPFTGLGLEEGADTSTAEGAPEEGARKSEQTSCPVICTSCPLSSSCPFWGLAVPGHSCLWCPIPSSWGKALSMEIAML
jgi:hypothetical protein